MNVNQLIILPCHSIWKGGATAGICRDEWHLAHFQIEGQDHQCFRDQIIECVRLLRLKPDAMLILWGGKTKIEAGPVSEAQSYYNLLRVIADDSDGSFLDRVFLEEYARDSFENVLFLLCRFYELTHKYPSIVTIQGFEFKRNRFINYHLTQALKFPKDRIFYYGKDPMPEPGSDYVSYLRKLREGEQTHAVNHFKTDPYGLKHPLMTKKSNRNPFNMKHRYHESNPLLRPFLEAISGTTETTELPTEFEFPW